MTDADLIKLRLGRAEGIAHGVASLLKSLLANSDAHANDFRLNSNLSESDIAGDIKFCITSIEKINEDLNFSR